MKATLSAAIAALESAAIALAVYALLCFASFAVWWFAFDLSADPKVVFAGSSALWMLGHLEPLRLVLTPEMMLSLGLPSEALAFVISFAPLGVSLMTGLLAFRMGARSAVRGGSGFAAIPGGILGFTIAATVIRFFAEPFLENQTWSAVVTPVAIYALGVLIGFVWNAIRLSHEWWQYLSRVFLRWVERIAPLRTAKLPSVIREIFALAGVLAAGLLLLSSLAVVVSIARGYIEIIALSQSLQLTAFGVVVLFLLNLLLLPNVLIWALSWFTGAGFSVGTDAFFSPFQSTDSALPPLPLIGALPTDWGWAAVLAPALVVCVSVCIGALHAGVPTVRRFGWVSASCVPLFAAALVGLAAALLAAVSGGSFGPGGFSESGVAVWQFAGVLAAECGAGVLLGAIGRRIELLIRQPGDNRLFSRTIASSRRAHTLGREDTLSTEAAFGFAQQSKDFAGITQKSAPEIFDAANQSTVATSAEQNFTASFHTVKPMSVVDSAERVVNAPPAATNAPVTDEHNTEALLRKYAWNPDATTNEHTRTNETPQPDPTLPTESRSPEANADTVPLDPLESIAANGDAGADADSGQGQVTLRSLTSRARKGLKWHKRPHND